MHPFLLLLIGMGIVVGLMLGFRLHAFLALTLAALTVALLTSHEQLTEYTERKVAKGDMTEKAAKKLSDSTPGERVAGLFGSTAGKIGILIAMAAVIGNCLLESGGADRVIRSTMALVGEKRAPIAFAGSGFILGIPVFFDTVFYLLIPLGKALAARSGRNFGLYVMTIAAGASIAHSLVPPTPGPLLVASMLSVNVADFIVVGLILGVLAVVPGVLYAYWADRKWPVPLRDAENLQEMSRREDKDLPPLWLSLLPIVLPVLLIVGDVLLQKLADSRALAIVGNKNVALALSAGVALLMLVKYRKGDAKVSASVQAALMSGGLIILITSAGGAFGGVLQMTMIDTAIGGLFGASGGGLMILVAAFFVTALVRAAQGSATVAMITSGGIFMGMASPEVLGCHPVYMAAIIGFGSKPFPWMNDSGFWVVCKMSGQTETETLRNHSVMFTVMGFAGFFVALVGAALFPMVSTP